MTILLTVLLAVGLLAGPGVADPGPAPSPPVADSTTYAFDNANSTMTIYGSSNVRDWTMDVTQINGSVTLNTGDELPSIQTVSVEIPVEQMVSDKDRLQRHAHEALHKDDYPTISFTSSDVQVAKADADSFSVVANGKMTIKGNTHAATVSAKGVRQSDGTINVVGEHRLEMTTYEVERPSLMFGAIKVDDPIRIAFDVTMRPTSTATSAATK